MTQIAIVVYPGFTALDFIGPYEVLRNLPDSGVLLIGATHSFDETPSPDILLVPGGMTTFEHARDEKLLDWVRRAHQTATWTASVCSGSVILAAAGLLEGKRATSHWLAVPMLKPFGVRPVSDERIVVAEATPNSIVTCAGVSAGIDLGMWLAGEIAGEGRAKAIQLAIEYDPQPPFDSGHISKASTATKATATAILSKDTVKAGQLIPSTLLLWDAALRAVRSKRRRRKREAISA